MKVLTGLLTVVALLAGVGTSEGAILKSAVIDHEVDLSTAWAPGEVPLQVARHCGRGGGYYGPPHHVRRYDRGYRGYGAGPRRRHHHHYPGYYPGYYPGNVYRPYAGPVHGSGFGLYIGF